MTLEIMPKSKIVDPQQQTMLAYEQRIAILVAENTALRRFIETNMLGKHRRQRRINPRFSL
jgi:hypothetical protein